MAGNKWAIKLEPPTMVPSTKVGRIPRYSTTGMGHMVEPTLAVHRPSMSLIFKPASATAAAPDSEPDHRVDIQTLPQAALIYRLSADLNPLHADPEVARAAGFDRPILHGLATYGIAARALVQACCGNNPAGLKQLSARFSSPVFPGELIRTEIWDDAGSIRYRCQVPERNVVVISNGTAEVRNV
jgi:acyl dehydratase